MPWERMAPPPLTAILPILLALLSGGGCPLMAVEGSDSTASQQPQEFLTAQDFARAELFQESGEGGDNRVLVEPLPPATEEKKAENSTTTYLSESDFERAKNFGPRDLYHNGDGKHRKNVLYRQRYFRGDIRGKAAWRRNRGRGDKKEQLLLQRQFFDDPDAPSLAKKSKIRRNGVSNAVKKWPAGRIPYVLSTQYNDRERAILARAFQEYHGRTCIRFVPRSPLDRDFLYIGKIDGCYSDVGRAGGRQELSLDDGCLHLDTVLHELMHSVGFYHEHERWDRDQFISILWENIDKEAYDQFGRVDLVESSYYGQPYDYRSLMHYDSMAFSRNGRETLVAKLPQMTSVIGSALDFSPVDLEKIKRMYGCLDPSVGGVVGVVEDLPPMGVGINEPLPLKVSPLPGDPNFNFRTPILTPALIQFARASGGTVLPPSALSRATANINANTINNRPREPPKKPLKRIIGLSGAPRVTGSGTLGANSLQQIKQQENGVGIEDAKSEECMDKAGLCWRWLNRCQLPHFERIMRDFCALSCGFCVPVPSVGEQKNAIGEPLALALPTAQQQQPSSSAIPSFDPTESRGILPLSMVGLQSGIFGAYRLGGTGIGGFPAQTQPFQQQQQQILPFNTLRARTARTSDLTSALAAQAEVTATIINALRKQLPITHPIPGVHWDFHPAREKNLSEAEATEVPNPETETLVDS